VPQEPAPPAAPPAASGTGDPDRLIAEARARLGGLGGQVDELLRFRESLQRTARELEDEYSRVLARIGAPAEPVADLATTPPAPPESLRGPIAPVDPSAGQEDHAAFGAAPAPAPAPATASFAVPPEGAFAPAPPPPVPAAPVPGVAPALAQPPAPPFAPAPVADPAAVAPAAYEPGALGFDPAPPPVAAPPVATPPVRGVPSPYDDTAFEGTIVLDAGPFTDISALSTFEQGLAHVPGAEDVYVSGFEGNRALVELRLVAPVALVREMRAVLPGGFAVAEVTAGRLRIDVHPTFDPTHRS
jgi:hypothetical protein